MPRLTLPVFDHAACRTSGLCVTLCPTDCLDLWNDRPGVKYPQACVSCAVCEIVCPTNAVRVHDDATERAPKASDG